MRLILIYAILVPVLFSSCIPQKRLTYLQDRLAVGDELKTEGLEYRLKTNDILYVRVMTTNPEMNELFNIDDRTVQRTAAASVGDPYMFLYGYKINQRGNIQLPVIGDVSVAGCTLEEAHELIQERTKEYLVDATVSVRLVNFKVTVLGEVVRPGTFSIYDEEFTVMDAIGVAGDMTDYGNRNVHIVRKTDEGRQFARLDVTDREAVNSDFYYLQPNDVIYVEPMVAKRFALAQFPYAVFFSVISTTILLINFLN